MSVLSPKSVVCMLVAGLLGTVVKDQAGCCVRKSVNECGCEFVDWEEVHSVIVLRGEVGGVYFGKVHSRFPWTRGKKEDDEMVAGRRSRKATATATGSCIVKEERCSSVVKSSPVLKMCKSESLVKTDKAVRKINEVVRKKGETRKVDPYKVVRKIETEKVVRKIKADKEVWECKMLEEVTTGHESSLGGWRTTEPLGQVVKGRDDVTNVLYTCCSRTTGCNLLDKICSSCCMLPRRRRMEGSHGYLGCKFNGMEIGGLRWRRVVRWISLELGKPGWRDKQEPPDVAVKKSPRTVSAVGLFWWPCLKFPSSRTCRIIHLGQVQ